MDQIQSVGMDYSQCSQAILQTKVFGFLNNQAETFSRYSETIPQPTKPICNLIGPTTWDEFEVEQRNSHYP